MAFNSKIRDRKIAIVHDAFAVKGGAEKVAYYISKVFPEAQIYSTVYLRYKTFEELKDVNIKSHFLSQLVKNEKQFKRLYPIWYLQMQCLNFNKFEVVLSSSTYLAKFIHAPKNGKHISYLHAPFRLIWNRQSYSDDSLPLSSFYMKLLDKFIPYLQKKDFRYTQKIDKLITNSKNMQQSIKKTYQRDSTIIHPPIEIKQYNFDTPKDFYLCVGRLISHKRINLVIKACNQLRRKLVVVGDGLEKENLVKVAGDTIQFVNNVDDQTLKNLYATCQALIFPSNEDFGIVPIEVQASGRPVIAYKAGGVLETVTEGVSGIFFNNQSVDDIIQAIEQFEKLDFSPEAIRSSVEKFDFEVFKNQYLSITQEN